MSALQQDLHLPEAGGIVLSVWGLDARLATHAHHMASLIYISQQSFKTDDSLSFSREFSSSPHPALMKRSQQSQMVRQEPLTVSFHPLPSMPPILDTTSFVCLLSALRSGERKPGGVCMCRRREEKLWRYWPWMKSTELEFNETQRCLAWLPRPEAAV